MRKRMTILFLLLALPFLAVASLGTLQVAAQEGGRAPAVVAPSANVEGSTLRAASPITATTHYTVTDLGMTSASGINDVGQVVGNVYDESSSRATLWDDGTLIDLGTLSGSSSPSSEAIDINDNGEAVGYSRNADDEFAAVMWQDGNIVPLHHTDTSSSAHAINNTSMVVGRADVDETNEVVEHAVFWQDGSRTDLHTGPGVASRAFDINDAGQVVGTYYDDFNVGRGVLWENGGMTDIAVDFGGGLTDAFGINEAGDIVGASRTATGVYHAFVKESDGTIIDLGTLGGPHSFAIRINEAGLAVGYSGDGAGGHRAFLWDGETMIDLNELIDPDSGWVLEGASDINDAGQIVGTGTYNGENRSFLLTPEQPPWTLMFYLDGDNNLSHTYPPIFNQLELAADNPAVNVVVLWDGPNAGDSAYYHVQDDNHLGALADYVEGETMWSQGEANMGFPTTLSDFASWAMEEFPARHYALILDDHGSGLGGSLVDDTSGRTMNLPEMQLALATIHEQTEEKIDVLFMAMCLMGMIEDAYQFRGHVDYYVANENLQWAFIEPYYPYVSGVTETSTPADVAQLFAASYADVGDARNSAYTISVVDMAQLDSLAAATQQLGGELDWYMEEISPTVTAVLSDVQRFDNRLPEGITTADTSIDLYHFADLVSLNLLDYGDVVIAATAVMSAVDDAVIYERHAGSGGTDLNNSHGISIFFPSNSSSFYHPDNYDFAVGANWDDLNTMVPAEEGGWGAMLVNYVRQVNPEGPDESTPPEPVPKLLPLSELFIPVIRR